MSNAEVDGEEIPSVVFDDMYTNLNSLTLERDSLVEEINGVNEFIDNTNMQWDGTYNDNDEKNMVAVKWTDISEVKSKIQYRDTASADLITNLGGVMRNMSSQIDVNSEQGFDWAVHRQNVVDNVLNKATDLKSVAYDEMIPGRSFYNDIVKNIEGSAYKDLGIEDLDDATASEYIKNNPVPGVNPEGGFDEDEKAAIVEYNENKVREQDMWIDKATDFVESNPDNTDFQGVLEPSAGADGVVGTEDDEAAGVINQEEAKQIVTQMIENPDYNAYLKGELADYFTQYLNNNWNSVTNLRVDRSGKKTKTTTNVNNDFSE
jgi:hypothetical protein